MLTKWETLFLMIMTVPIIGHVVILPLIFDVTGRDSWISVLLALPVGLLFTWLIYRLRRMHPKKDFPQLLHSLMGKVLSFPILFIFIIYFLFLSSFSLAALADMTFIAFLPETPTWSLLLWAIIFCLFAAAKGVKRIAQTAGVLTFIAMITGHSITLLDTPKKEFANILPILEFGWSPVILGTLIIISIWMEFTFLMLVPLKGIQEKKFYFFWIIGVLLNGLTMISTMTGTIMIFGIGQVDNMTYPALEIVRLITLGFIDRFDIYGLILMTFGCYIRGSLYIKVAFDLIFPRKIRRNWIKNMLLIGLAIPVFLFANYLTENHMTLGEFTIYYSYTICLLPLPLVLLVLSWLKRKKSSIRPTKST